MLGITSLPDICSDLVIGNIGGYYSKNCSQGRTYKNETTSFINVRAKVWAGLFGVSGMLLP